MSASRDYLNMYAFIPIFRPSVMTNIITATLHDLFRCNERAVATLFIYIFSLTWNITFCDNMDVCNDFTLKLQIILLFSLYNRLLQQ